MEDAKVGISSFGFAGSNAHVVITAPREGANRPPYEARTEERQSGSGSEAVPKQVVISHEAGCEDFSAPSGVPAEDFTRPLPNAGSSETTTKNQGDMHDEHVEDRMFVNVNVSEKTTRPELPKCLVHHLQHTYKQLQACSVLDA